MGKHVGYVGVPYEELGDHVGKNIIVYHRDAKRTTLFSRTEGTLSKSPLGHNTYEVDYYLGEPTAILIISPENEVFVRGPNYKA